MKMILGLCARVVGAKVHLSFGDRRQQVERVGIVIVAGRFVTVKPNQLLLVTAKARFKNYLNVKFGILII